MWYEKIVHNGDLSIIPDCIDYYEDEYKEAKKECRVSGNIEKLSARLPGVVENRYTQLQEIEAILKYLELQHRKVKQEKVRTFFENYNKSLTYSAAQDYAEAEPEVVDMTSIIIHFSLLRNKYLSIMKGLEIANWQIGHIVKLRIAGMEDSEIYLK